MPAVEFEATIGAGGPRVVRVEAPDGGALIDMCDESSAPVAFSCRSASCGTCRVEVVEGADMLEPPKAPEIEVLEVFGDEPGKVRLACQTRVKPGRGVVRVRSAP
ncbi:MAG: 2Fe-2S iron-sulfur cluster-binding protein [Polyangiaceae bacterium]